ncbi:hypothetical protein D3C81_1769370 [compost metagenome]
MQDADVDAGFLGLTHISFSVIRPRIDPTIFPEAEGWVAAMSRDATSLGLALDDGYLFNALFTQLNGG